MKTMMKNKQHIKPMLWGLLLFIATACNNSPKPKDTVEMVKDQNQSKFEDTKTEDDAKFLVKAAGINIQEIMLGQMAQQKSTTKHVKALGKMMEEAHTKSLVDLTALANTKTISVPSLLTFRDSTQYRELYAMNNKEFDVMYCTRMVEGHEAAIILFENATIRCKDADIKAWAIATLPELKMHLEHSIMAKKKSQKTK